MSDMCDGLLEVTPGFTDAQLRDWPGAVAEAQKYVDSSTISTDIGSSYWTVVWGPQTRPGRGWAVNAAWFDGEYFVQILMDVYGYPSVLVAEMSFVHSSSYEECGCEPCTKTREEEE